MTLQELIQLFRQDVDDTVEPYLWSQAEAIEYANDAELEACRRARLLLDSTTAEICEVAVTAGEPVLTLDARVLFVRRARFAGALPLKRMSMQDMEEHNPYWLDAEASTPRAFVPDYQTGALMLYPPPDADGTLLLTVVRDPLAEMNDDLDTPEIAARYHRSLRYWMRYRAFSKPDTEAHNPKAAAESLALFEQEFGKKSSAIDETWIAREQMEHDGTF